MEVLRRLAGARLLVASGLENADTLLVGEPVMVHDLTQEPRFRSATRFLEHGVVSGISVIIYVNGHPYGVLGAHTRKRRQFNDEEIDFLKDWYQKRFAWMDSQLG